MKVFSKCRPVATIVRTNLLADNYQHDAPWQLAHKDGRVEMFKTYNEACEAVTKTYSNIRFSR
jgi:hypothetical protein